MPDKLLPMPEDWHRALAIAAHPDDIEWGTAGAVAGWTAAGKDVSYLLVTRGEAGIDGMAPDQAGPLREAEERAAAAAVGVQTVEFLDHCDGVIEYGTALRRDLALAIRWHRPELVIATNHHDYWRPGAWNSPDHKAVGRATVDAAADAGNRWIFPPDDDDPEPWPGVRWVAIASSPLASHVVDVSGRRDQAIASLAAHTTYLRALSDTPPKQRAAELIDEMTATDPAVLDGRPYCAFELITL